MIMSFDFLREPHSAVPLYADECGSLGFVAFSTVSGVSKNTFLTRCTQITRAYIPSTVLSCVYTGESLSQSREVKSRTGFTGTTGEVLMPMLARVSPP